jgi:hypothetical protein
VVARVAGASLGLFAFMVSVIAGLVARNSTTLILSRSILALFVFCLIGLVLGAAAQKVVSEHGKTREEEIKGRFREPAEDGAESREDSPAVDDSADTAQVA